MATQLFSSSDAHGTFRPVTVGAPCATIAQLVKEQPELELLSTLTPILTDSRACNTGDEHVRPLASQGPHDGRLRAVVLTGRRRCADTTTSPGGGVGHYLRQPGPLAPRARRSTPSG